MRAKSNNPWTPGSRAVKGIRRAPRRQYSAEEKIRIVLDGLRGEDSIAELCRREGIAQSLYYVWSKEFLEAGNRRPRPDQPRHRITIQTDRLLASKRLQVHCRIRFRVRRGHWRAGRGEYQVMMSAWFL